jgi:hypothetical protein
MGPRVPMMIYGSYYAEGEPCATNSDKRRATKRPLS